MCGYLLLNFFLSRNPSMINQYIDGFCVLMLTFGFLQGTTCDVKNGEDVKNLVSFAKEKLKYIDIWVLMSDFSFPCQLFKIWHFLVVIPFCRLLAMVDCGGCFFTTVMAYLWTIAAPWRFMADMVAYNGELLAFHHGHHVQSITQLYQFFNCFNPFILLNVFVKVYI
jgi:hypothetical protein